MGNISTLRVLQHQYLLFEFYLSFAFFRVITAEVVFESVIHPLSANPTKWWNILKQFVGKSRRIVTNCLNVFDHFVGLALKGLWKIFNLESSTKTMRLTNTLKHHLPQARWYLISRVYEELKLAILTTRFAWINGLRT